jgi:hypothetical protein
VTDRTQTIAATVVGAVLGGMAGYMFFTDKGRHLRRQLEPAIEDISRELANFRGTLTRAMGVANDGWKVLNEVMGEGGAPVRYSNPHQTTPF